MCSSGRVPPAALRPRRCREPRCERSPAAADALGASPRRVRSGRARMARGGWSADRRAPPGVVAPGADVPLGVEIALTVAVGIAAGVLSGMFGVGGAVLTTPAIRVLGATAF